MSRHVLNNTSERRSDDISRHRYTFMRSDGPTELLDGKHLPVPTPYRPFPSSSWTPRPTARRINHEGWQTSSPHNWEFCGATPKKGENFGKDLLFEDRSRQRIRLWCIWEEIPSPVQFHLLVVFYLKFVF